MRGISLKGQAGTNAYLYLQSIEVSRDKPPVARVEMEIRQSNAIKPLPRILGKGDNLFDKSGMLDQYKGFVVADINANESTLSFTNGVVLTAGDAVGDVNEMVLRRLQIREAVTAHFEKEQQLFARGIKVLSLFFIDEVAKYRLYEGNEEKKGEYAAIFEEEYNTRLNEVLTLDDDPYNRYLRGIATSRTHEGYFSIDKKSKRFVNPGAKGESAESDDVDAYDLILKRKAQLLSFEEPVRFIFAHSALREGWDNPNVFVIGMLKKADPENVTSRRQEVGRGLRLSVNQRGDRMDDPATVHELNVLTVVASEGYKEFVAGLQKDIAAAVSARPHKADEAYFTGKVLKTAAGDVPVTPHDGKAAHPLSDQERLHRHRRQDHNRLPRCQTGWHAGPVAAGVGAAFNACLPTCRFRIQCRAVAGDRGWPEGAEESAECKLPEEGVPGTLEPDPPEGRIRGPV